MEGKSVPYFSRSRVRGSLLPTHLKTAACCKGDITMKKRITMKLSKLAIPCLLALMLVGTSAAPSAAEEPTNKQKEASSSAEQVVTGWWEAPWRFNVNVYAWAAESPGQNRCRRQRGGAHYPGDVMTTSMSGIQLGGDGRSLRSTRDRSASSPRRSMYKLKDQRARHRVCSGKGARLPSKKKCCSLMDYGVSYKFEAVASWEECRYGLFSQQSPWSRMQVFATCMIP